MTCDVDTVGPYKQAKRWLGAASFVRMDADGEVVA